MVSKGQQLSITSLDVNMDAGTDTVSVYARPGNLVASNDGGWLLIKSFEITGQGRGVVTSLPDFDSPIIVPAGFKQSFYIETNSTDIDFWYGDGTELGTVLSSNDDLSVLEGYAIGHAWRGFAAPRQWNGAVHYSVAANVPTASPVLEPTSSPSSSAAPSLKVCQYVSLAYIRNGMCLAPTNAHLFFFTSEIIHFLALDISVTITNEWLCVSSYCG